MTAATLPQTLRTFASKEFTRSRVVSPQPALAGRLAALSARHHRSMPQPPFSRRQALLDLGVDLAGTDERLDRVVELARARFRTSHAALVLSDGARLSFKSKAGFRGTPDLVTLASPTIDTGRPVVIGSTDPAIGGRPSFQVGGADMGFYAGYPIEAPDGSRIGVLSVFDPEPRAALSSAALALRDLALMLQRELWATASNKEFRE